MKKMYNVIGKAVVYATLVWIEFNACNYLFTEIFYDWKEISYYVVAHVMFVLFGVQFYGIYCHDLATLRLWFLKKKMEFKKFVNKEERAA